MNQFYPNLSDQSFMDKNSSTLSSISFGKVLKAKDQAKYQLQTSINRSNQLSNQVISHQDQTSLMDAFQQYQKDPCSDYFAICNISHAKLFKLPNQNFGQYIQSMQCENIKQRLKQKPEKTYKMERIDSVLKKLQKIQNQTKKEETQQQNQQRFCKNNSKSKDNVRIYKQFNFIQTQQNLEANDRVFSFQKCRSILSQKESKIQIQKQSLIEEVSQLGLQSQLNDIGIQSKIKFSKELSQIKQYPKKQIIENIKDKNNPQKIKFKKKQDGITAQGMIKGLQFSKKLKKKKLNIKGNVNSLTNKNYTDPLKEKQSQNNYYQTSQFRV